MVVSGVSVACAHADDSANLPSSKNDADLTAVTMHSHHDRHAMPSVVLLKTAKACVSAGDRQCAVNILIDEGSQATFIKQSVADYLNLPVLKRCTIQNFVFGGHRITNSCNLVTFELKTLEGSIPVRALVIPDIVQIDQTGWSECTRSEFLDDKPLADSFDHDLFDVHILIGADSSWCFLKSAIHKLDTAGPVVQESAFGLLLSGPLQSSRPTIHNDQNVSTLLNVRSLSEHVAPQLFQEKHSDHSQCCHSFVKKSLSMDSIGLSDPQAVVPCDFQDDYCNRIAFDETNHQYVAPLPWRTEHLPLPSNLNSSRSRLLQVTTRLQELGLFEAYANVMREHMEKRYVEHVPEEEGLLQTTNCHYLPHFYVLKESTTTPLRIVFDASAGRVSLNDCLETGPCLLNNLLTILLRFRIHRYAFCADIARAFLAIQVKEEDRNFLRFLWYKNNDPDDAIISLRYRCLTFGPTCSPFILNAILKHHLDLHDTDVTRDMAQKIYVDNLASGCETEHEAEEYFHQSRFLLQEAGMNLRQWASNSPRVQELSANESVAHKSDQISLLGLTWHSDSDILSFHNKVSPNEGVPLTKRLALSIASSLFDPFGFASPIIMPLKHFLSKLWDLSVGWDEILSEELSSEFHTLVSELDLIRLQFSVPRNFGMNMHDTVQVHLFCDASRLAMGCVVYFVQGSQSVLVCSRLKIVPKNKRHVWTIPKLELNAMLLGSRLVSNVLHSYGGDIPFHSIHAWTDSEICLHWLASDKVGRQKVFVANRVSEIKKLIPTQSWSHVRSEDNAADIATRGCSAKALMESHLWLHGPPWLPMREKWPRWNPEKSDELEVRATVVTTNQESAGLSSLIDVSRFNSFSKLVNTMALVLRFITKARNPAAVYPSRPSGEEIRAAELRTIHLLQKEHFSDEFEFLAGNNTEKKPPLVHSLNLLLKDNVLRAAGRLQSCSIGEDMRLPMLLPKNNETTTLIIRHYHSQVFHAGVPATVTSLRQKFWLPSARSQCQKVLRKCITCRRFNSCPFRPPPPPDLPDFRVNDLRPFESIGVDFSGSLTVRTGPHSFSKCYICIFSCCTTRNINLELVPDMSTESFLLALRSHCADYGSPRLILSDNAKTFKKADQELQNLFSLVSSSETERFLSQRQISLKPSSELRCRNIPVKAPWWGGFYERFVGIVKMCLKKVLGRACVSFEELRVLLKEIKSTLNNRPLVPRDSSSDDLEALTPSHLLFGFQSSALPHPHVALEEIETSTSSDSPASLNRMASRRAMIYQHYIQRFQHEYFAALRERHFYQQRTPSSFRVTSPSVGELVLIHDDDVSRLRWRLGIIEGLITGADGHVRAAHLRTSTGKTNRAISKLYPLELMSETARSQVTSDTSSRATPPVGATGAQRPRRAAAEIAIRGLQAMN